MAVDEQRIDGFALALLHLNFDDDHGLVRAWKRFDWAAMDRLQKKGWIEHPNSRAKSAVVTEQGQKLSKELFQRYFGSYRSYPGCLYGHVALDQQPPQDA